VSDLVAMLRQCCAVFLFRSHGRGYTTGVNGMASASTAARSAAR
jgi:hypothetical protein